ncbi:cation:dicarboxylate symporter family transporter [Breznakia pachnodae]|uniref:L-cystine uptake protein TcyP n=1 Tax=Breznakia pachnodae TaxID=265178 RepID=A0ABU0E7D7_9FIRM|nr:cation:dicarboxylase symporter family transporter [Breznakia pachnodae]MDQ0362631.1 L-cystine uptake protein TcyP (sodium:dicarboxylate symporter family) [Breznakia pachnodae]
MNQSFFEKFLMISQWQTVLLIAILAVTFGVVFYMTKKKISFSARVMVAMVLGLALGLFIQMLSGFPDDPSQVTYVNEATTWYGLFGNGFMSLIKMLVIPLVLVSIIHVIINMEEGAKIGKLVRNSLIITMTMVAIASLVGLTLGILFGVGEGVSVVEGTAEIKEVSSVVTTLTNLIPSNPVEAMVNMNVIGIVIFAAFLGVGARRMHGREKYKAVIEPFYAGINALHQIIISITMTIIKLMPYAVVPLLANTIALRGLSSIVEVGKFILVLYLAIVIMFVLQLVQLTVFGVNPINYLKKGLRVFILAFTSRSSVGVLPVTIDSLTKDMGVNQSTASFVASFGTTAGMQGCAGVFPALLLVYVANMSGVTIDITFIIMAVIVVTLGSLGIAGIPGTATMAASVALSGMGMESLFPTISPILAIDPLIDMGRTLLNVSGSMANAIAVDRSLGTIDMDVYRNNEITVNT